MTEERHVRAPRHPDLTEAVIARVVHAFYGRIRSDDILGPVFERVIAGDWTPHLAKMCDFWSSVMLATGRYEGNPMMAHIRLKDVRPEHFERWLGLFRATARDVCPTELAAVFIARAENIARSLQMGMFYRPAMATGAPLPTA